MNVAVDFKNVDIIFGAEPQRALALIEKGASRAEILSKPELCSVAPVQTSPCTRARFRY
jgi:ABC-type proline/glycine betaine transport system ATPase subunit